MEIGYYNQTYKYNQPRRQNFTSIYDYNGVKYRDTILNTRSSQNSTGKREDLDYDKLAKIIMTRFKDCDKVNIMPMNVSDGTEAYYIFKPLMEEVGPEEFERKYGKIAATDVYRKIVETYPKRGLVQLYKSEPDELRICNKPMFEQVDKSQYEDSLIKNSEYSDLYKLKPEYRKYFSFETQDFQDRLDNLHDEGNSVVIIRNCLRQSFGDMESALIVDKVARKLKGASLFITGGYDRGMPLFESALEDNFVEIAHNVWAKRDYVAEETHQSESKDVIYNLTGNKSFLDYYEKMQKSIPNV